MAVERIMAGADLITATTFVRQSSVWTQVIPTMDPVVQAANTLQTSLGSAVPNHADSRHNAIIAETAFIVADVFVANESMYFGDWRAKETPAFKAKRAFKSLGREPGPEANFTEDEWLEVGLLARIMRSYISDLETPIFSPSIPGCGVVDMAIGDVLAGSELIEIKTVTRPFRTYDFRQALTYAAMFYSANHVIENITLLNPRRARVVKMPVGEIAALIRGDSAVELLQDLIETMMELQVSA